MKRITKQIAICLLLLAVYVGSLWAGDGQIDIAELPYTISQSGSYVVTSDLTPSSTDTNGITIYVDNVVLDFNGHTLIGPGKSAGTTGSGIYVSGSYKNIVVRNGTIRDWRSNAIDTSNATNSQFSDLQLYNNGSNGIYAGSNCTVKNTICSDNGSYGISIGSGCVVSGNVCKNNTGMGISAGIGVVVSGNSCILNSFNGIYAASGSTVTENACSDNTAIGIAVGYGSTVSKNTCKENGTDGIFTEYGCSVSGNTCVNNTVNGIRVFSYCKVQDNNCDGNGYLTGDGAGILAASNSNQIINNHCVNNDRGIDLGEANNIVSGNTLRANTTPILAVANNQLDVIISELPYTISYPGTYRLSGDLSLSTPNADGITIDANNVTIDLSGHSLTGPGKSAGTTGSGIRISVGSYYNITIRNGTIRDWREHGVYGANAGSGVIETLFCYNNGGMGIYSGYQCNVRDAISNYNGDNGIKVRQQCMVSKCSSNANGGNGILTEGFCNVSSNMCNYNSLDGIYVDMDDYVSGNTCENNTGDGIKARLRCRLEDNLCKGNGASGGDGAGINLTSSGNTVERNVVQINDRGIDSNPATGNFITNNRASGNTTDYDILPANAYGEIVNMTTGGIIMTYDPDANFRF